MALIALIKWSTIYSLSSSWQPFIKPQEGAIFIKLCDVSPENQNEMQTLLQGLKTEAKLKKKVHSKDTYWFNTVIMKYTDVVLACVIGSADMFFLTGNS